MQNPSAGPEQAIQRNQMGKSGLWLSVIGLGGHEFLPDGRVKGMGEDFYTAVKPGVTWDGFGGENRRQILAAAYRAGINLFDVTMDAEKEALGRNMAEMLPHEIYVQTRPEGMVYNNDPADTDKTKLLDYSLLKAEAERSLKLLRRERHDLYNLGLFPPAIERQPGYIGKLARNVERLKQDGLIRFACVDTLSGEAISLQMIETGSFDAVFTNLSILNDAALRRVAPAAIKRGMGILAREVFAKGQLFAVGEAAGIRDRSQLARAAVRWVLSQGVVTALIVGVATPEQLTSSLGAARSLAARENAEHEATPSDQDRFVLDALRASPEFAGLLARQHEIFIKGFI